eukprot:symbB.v1.2.042098.t1/scaffold9238.1/size5961/1
MAQKPGMSHDEWVKLQILLGQAQESGLVSEALVGMGLGDGLAQQVGSEIESSQQSVVRPKAKAKQAGGGTRDGSSTAEDYGYTLVTSEGVAPAAMTDASKRLFDAVDDGVGEVGTPAVDVSATVPPTPMNRTMRAWQRDEGNLSAPNAPRRQTNEAKRLYPSIPLDNGNGQEGQPQGSSVAMGSGGPTTTSRSARVVLIDDENNGLPEYSHPAPPMGPVRELWHVASPINGEIPIPTGIQDLQHWSTTVIQMEKYKGKTFGEILELIRMGNRDVIQWASWLVHRYSHAISKTPKTQAPDMAAYLLRCGFDPDERRTESISYVRTYSGHRMAQ